MNEQSIKRVQRMSETRQIHSAVVERQTKDIKLESRLTIYTCMCVCVCANTRK